MQVLATLNGFIQHATNDAGTIKFSPIHNDAIEINGRPVWRKNYLNAAGMVTAEEVDDATWDEVCELTAAVLKRNQAEADAQRERAFARQEAEAESIAKSLKGTRGTYTDRNTF